jgi:hypothetical protein
LVIAVIAKPNCEWMSFEIKVGDEAPVQRKEGLNATAEVALPGGLTWIYSVDEAKRGKPGIRGILIIPSDISAAWNVETGGMSKKGVSL